MNRVLIACLLACTAIASDSLNAKAQSKEPTKPNILVIFGDDIGWMNVSSYGGDIMGVQTPNIDRIGKEGLRLTSFYAQPSCTAGRAAFITGQLPVRTGLTTVGTPGSPAGLQKEDITLAEILKTHGYATAQFGKNHLGDLEEHLPHRHGFDEFWGNLYHLNGNEDLEDPDRPTNPEFRKKFDPRGIVSGTADGPTKDEGPLTVKRMETFDDEVARQVAGLPRSPRQGRQALLPLAQLDPPACLHSPEGGSRRASRARAAKTSTAMDSKEHDGHVGQLLDKLDQTGLDKNTIVIYTTDNGAYQYMWPEGGTSPFRGDKGTTWEGGVRVPFLIRWPGAPGGRVSSEIVDMTDLLPTLAAAAGEPDVVEKLKKGATYGGRNYKLHLDGFDQTALFTGKSDESARNFVFYYDETVLTAIRYKQFKITFSAKVGGHWDDPAAEPRPAADHQPADGPVRAAVGRREPADDEHKTWVLTPILGIVHAAPCDLQGVPGPPGRPERRCRQDDRGHPVADPEDAACELTGRDKEALQP